MSSTKELLEELDGKVSKLLLNLSELSEASKEKDQVINSLQAKLHEKDQTIASIEKEREDLMKSAAGNNQQELKVKIGEMVKEIDRCISLLKV